ncbi:creatininase family protein [Spiribacter vilamensis]|uniref:Creatinine amidohydrolase n=1 Tax=Spiribacter vilamensis TaxID=531306 RepID=A0A4Q8CYJ5_9GAMM|nr:creatininase family protein [Spiribacter vilamensis]RZU98066.1 creatinine amidohydrolase [Spiribacter vilamensis]
MTISEWGGHTTQSLRAVGGSEPVALLPLGAVEQHGPHLPLSTDARIAEGLSQAAIERCADDVSVLRLPTLNIGQSIEHADYPGTLALEPATFEAMLYDIGASVARSGFRRLVMFSAHGGNLAAMDTAALRLRRDLGLLVIKACYFDFPPPVDAISAREAREGLHGGALETALMRHFSPAQVVDHQVDHAVSVEYDALAAFEWIGAETRPARFAWLAGDLNPTGVTGDARCSDAALGARLAAHYAESLAAIVAETAGFPLARLSTPHPLT